MFVNLMGKKAVRWLRRLVAGLLPHIPVFDRRLVYVGFVVDIMAPGEVYLRKLRCCPC